jgi:hypothetical protein
MSIAPHHARLLVIVATSFLIISPGLAARQTGGASGTMVWTGTVTVERRASGSFRASADATLGFTGRQTVTYTLNGDGTASWHATFSNNTDMGGNYGIPSKGSGSGVGFGGAGFNGQGWDIGVDSEDDMAIVTDYTAQDTFLATRTFLAGLIEMAKAMGKSLPPLGVHLEDGRTGVPGAEVPSRGAANASSLSGSVTETVNSSQDIGGPPMIPMTITVTWSLKKAPVRPHTKIYGPECGCLDPDATEKTLHFIAGASPAGGEFSEFIVSANGNAPEIVSNNGGDKPSLDIIGTKNTGTVTLKIRYTRNGVRTDSAPVIVDFCAIEKIELADNNEHDIGFDLDGKLLVDAKAKAWRGGKEISTELEWDLERMGAPTSLSAEPPTKKSDRVKFTYDNMPKRNSDFGDKKLTAKTTGKCDCQRDETIRTFFPDVDSNHPDDSTPNWYYYWKQTAAAPAAARAIMNYQKAVTDPNMTGTPIARYDQESGKLLLSDLVFGRKACRDEVSPDTHTATGRHAEGIDCFAETVRHEMQHRTDAIDWWGSPSGPYSVTLAEWFLRDWDHDQVPNAVEENLPGCRPGTLWPTDVLSTANSKLTWFTCQQRPFQDATDAEINAYYRGWTWPIGSVDSEDWSCGDLSKQWKGKKCGR